MLAISIGRDLLFYKFLHSTNIMGAALFQTLWSSSISTFMLFILVYMYTGKTNWFRWDYFVFIVCSFFLWVVLWNIAPYLWITQYFFLLFVISCMHRSHRHVASKKDSVGQSHWNGRVKCLVLNGVYEFSILNSKEWCGKFSV